MANLWLLDVNQLLKAKSAITPDNKDLYIDVLCEKLAEINGDLQQFKEIVHNETMVSDPSPDDLQDLVNELKNEIQDLKIDISNLNDELYELKGETLDTITITKLESEDHETINNTN